MIQQRTRLIIAPRFGFAAAWAIGLVTLSIQASGLSDALAASSDGSPQPATSADESAAAPAETWRPAALDAESLDTIVRGNIFNPAQRRGEPKPEPDKPEGEPTEASKEPEETGPPPESSNPDNGLLLIGISIHDGQPCAFIEDRAAGKVRRVREPGEIGRGRITAIDLDGVTYQVEGAEQRIKPGRTLAGNPPGSAAAATAASESGGTGSGTSSSARSGSEEGADDDGDSSRADILRRMRQRRAKERSD